MSDDFQKIESFLGRWKFFLQFIDDPNFLASTVQDSKLTFGQPPRPFLTALAIF